jgi:hypothetical protein
MGFCLVPKDGAVGDVFVNFWNWRPTVNLIGSFNLIDSERVELLQTQCCGAEVSAEEAVQIAERIERDVLAKLPEAGRVLLDLSVTTEPDDYTFHKGDEFPKNYSATAEWLRKFVAFCRSSGGFSVL